MSFIWLVIVILLVIVEAISINLTTIWFVASGLVALILSFIVGNFLIEFAVFTILGLILLITTRPIFTKMLKQHRESTNLDRVVGMKGIVTEEIKKLSTGEVKVDGKRWTAYADKKITVDSTVEILEINGVKLKVKEVDE